jgi:multidrug efflux system outer membrane protein
MKQLNKYLIAGSLLVVLSLSSCVPSMKLKTEDTSTPQSYGTATDTVNSAKIKWNEFFADPYLVALIDSALKNNQELNIMLQEVNIANNEVRARKGEYLPSVNLGVGAGVERVGKYTSQGVSDEVDEYEPGKHVPEHLQDYRQVSLPRGRLTFGRSFATASRQPCTVTSPVLREETLQ